MPPKGVTLKGKSVRFGSAGQFSGIGVPAHTVGTKPEVSNTVQAHLGSRPLTAAFSTSSPVVYYGRKPTLSQQRTTFDKVFAWICSILLHCIGFMVLLILYTLLKPPVKPPPMPMVVPESFYHGSQTNRELRKTQIQQGKLLSAQEHSMETWAHAIAPLNSSALLSSSKAKRLSIIGVSPATLGTQWDVYTHAGFGTRLGVPGGAVLGGMTVTFFGVTSRANKVVFIIDHSGSMIGRLHLVRAEVRRAINHLMPFQKFAIVVFAANPHILGNQTGLVGASRPVVRQMDYLLKGHHILAEGRNDGMVQPFARAFRVAYAMKPDVIYFLTDGHFNPRLVNYISMKNLEHPVPVDTFSLLSRNPEFENEMRRIAVLTHGIFHLISRRQLYREN